MHQWATEVDEFFRCLGSVYEMIYMSMPACQQACYADMEMPQWPKYAPLYMIYVPVPACR